MFQNMFFACLQTDKNQKHIFSPEPKFEEDPVRNLEFETNIPECHELLGSVDLVTKSDIFRVQFVNKYYKGYPNRNAKAGYEVFLNS